MSKTQHIYFICDSDRRFIKMGVSNNPGNRLFDIQACCPLDLMLDLVIDFDDDRSAALRYEDALHQHFAEYWRHREWFLYGPRIRAYVTSWQSGVCAEIPLPPHTAKQSVGVHGVCLSKNDFMALLRDRQRV